MTDREIKIGDRVATKRYTQAEILARFRNTHGDKYDYSKVVFETVSDKVCIICPEHGEYWQKPSMHIRGQQCPKCASRERGIRKRMSKNEFIERTRQIHGDKYDYSQSNFKTTKDKITIICPIHGAFEQNLSQHLIGRGCPKCANDANKSLVHGIGVNDLHTGQYSQQCYQEWSGMLYRCYKSGWKRYVDVTVCEEWHILSNFKRWFEDPANGYLDGYQLDKDILVKGNRIYSPDACCFVPSPINTLLAGCNNKKRGKIIGVRLESPGSYLAQITKHHKSCRIGLFPTKEEAFKAYKREKESYIREMAKNYFDNGAITEKVYNALLDYEVEITD